MNRSLAKPVPTAKIYSPLLEGEPRNVDELPPRPSTAVESPSTKNPPMAHRMFAFEDGMLFLSYAAQALSRDEFSKCFEPKPTVQPNSAPLYWIYVAGIAIRYGFLFPIRLGVLIVSAAFFLTLLPLCYFWRSQHFMRWSYRTFSQVWLFSFSAIIRHHGQKPDPHKPHLFVANHTSFIDFFLLSSHGIPHATVAQVHGGLFGWLQNHVLSLNGSLFFNRQEHRDRLAISRRMQAHINKRPQIAPLIIFPEGTCVNNESTVLFHKGAFELDALICPVAIKYNKRLLDPYWNTREQTFTQHVLYLMTRWIMVADVWWLPPQSRKSGESSIQFANRVKALISETAGLQNLSWDGYMKNCMRRQDQEKMRKSSQEKYVSSLRQRITPGPPEVCSAGEGEKRSMSVAAATAHSSLENIPLARKKRSCSISHWQDQPDSSSHLNLPDANPNPLYPAPYLPSWLSDAAIVDIKNELLLAGSKPVKDPSLDLIRHIRDRKDGVVQTWRHYTRSSRRLPNDHHSIKPESHLASHITDCRLENSSWRYWFKQRMEDGRAETARSPAAATSAPATSDLASIPLSARSPFHPAS